MQSIALIINTLQAGGAERCAADLSIIFNKRGFRVFIFTDLSFNAMYEYAGTLVDYNFNLSNKNKDPEDNPLQDKVIELKRLKNNYKIDIAISFMQLANAFNILSKDKEKVILTTHSLNSEYAKYENSIFWKEETFRDLYQYADLITFPSEYCKKDWIEHYGDKNGITRIVYNPVHTMPVQDNQNKENIVIAVGRMHSIKRQWHLVKAFTIVKKSCPDSRLVILGDGELRPELEKLIVRFGLKNDVEMPGSVKNVQEYLAKAKVFAMTSRCEAMPCSVLEALSAGVPVVSCDSPGGIREELGICCELADITVPLIGECGIITPYIRENSMDVISIEEKMLADEIIHLLKDNDLRNQMAKAAAKRVQRFLPDVIGGEWINDIFKNKLNRQINNNEFQKIREKSISSYRNLETDAIKMYIAYYRLLEKWMVLHEKGVSITRYFISKGIENIIIYGLGKMAKHLIEDIKYSSVSIVCAIDVRAINKYGEFPVIIPDEKIPDADCVVITPVHETESIKQKLSGKTRIPLISLSDIIDECMQ